VAGTGRVRDRIAEGEPGLVEHLAPGRGALVVADPDAPLELVEELTVPRREVGHRGAPASRRQHRDRVDEAVDRPPLPADDEVDRPPVERCHRRHVRRPRGARVERLPRIRRRRRGRAVEEPDLRLGAAGLRVDDEAEQRDGAVALRRAQEDLLSRPGEHGARDRMVHDRELDLLRARLSRPADARNERALAERQGGEDALELMVALGIRAERRRHVDPIELDRHVGERDPIGDCHIHARGTARHEARRARHHAQRECAVVTG